MSANGWLQFAFYSLVLLATVRPVGVYMTRVLEGQRTWLDPVFRPFERLIYKLCRELVICDPGVWYCFCVPTPIWVKHNYRIQIARPTGDFMCHPLGRSGMVWEYLKDPPYAGVKGAEGNFLWIITRKRDCCMSGD